MCHTWYPTWPTHPPVSSCHRSASVGRRMSFGSAWPGVPYALRAAAPSRMLCPVMPWPRGNVPVPIVACAQAVTAGNDPVIALR